MHENAWRVLHANVIRNQYQKVICSGSRRVKRPDLHNSPQGCENLSAIAALGKCGQSRVKSAIPCDHPYTVMH